MDAEEVKLLLACDKDLSSNTFSVKLFYKEKLKKSVSVKLSKQTSKITEKYVKKFVENNREYMYFPSVISILRFIKDLKSITN